MDVKGHFDHSVCLQKELVDLVSSKAMKFGQTPIVRAWSDLVAAELLLMRSSQLRAQALFTDMYNSAGRR